MAAYYNEIDTFAAAWLRELIKAGLIADGEVDERSIADVAADDVRGFTQCHFFAGIGGWSYALRLAGWPDDRPVWTGSCPCQPFSSAGAQLGGADPRDLWPTWRVLIAQCRPGVVFGEQVEAAIGHGWLDRLHDGLEAEGYAIGAAGLPSASVGAFDIRQRLWFVADTDGGFASDGDVQRGGGYLQQPAHAIAGVMADPPSGGQRIDRGAPWHTGHVDERVAAGELADSASGGPAGRRQHSALLESGAVEGTAGLRALGDAGASHWHQADWIACADGKTRPVEPGTFPLAHGIPARVGRLRGYGNAINPYVAATFIEAYMMVKTATPMDARFTPVDEATPTGSATNALSLDLSR